MDSFLDAAWPVLAFAGMVFLLPVLFALQRRICRWLDDEEE
jgi:hypothetical protein